MSALIAAAAWIIGAHLITAQPVTGMDAETPGLYAVHQPTQLAAGVLRNGNGYVNTWAGRNFSTADGTLTLTVGAVAGVQRAEWTPTRCMRARPTGTPTPCFARTEHSEVLPLVAASARLPIDDRRAVRVTAWPMRTDAGLRTAVSLSFEVAL